VQVSLSKHYRAVHSTMLPSLGAPAIALFGHHALKLLLVAFWVMFLVSLAAFLLYIFTLPTDRGRGN
jgi:hypothetical protein